MSGPALLVLGLALTGSPVLASSLLAGLTVSAAVGGPLLGVLLDRSRRPGRLLALSLAGYAAGLVTILAGLGRMPEPLLIAVAVLAGLLGPALAGGWTAQLPLVVPARELPRANAIDAMTYNAAGLVGPAIVGVLATTAGTWSALIASVALVLAALPTALTLPAPPRTSPANLVTSNGGGRKGGGGDGDRRESGCPSGGGRPSGGEDVREGTNGGGDGRGDGGPSKREGPSAGPSGGGGPSGGLGLGGETTVGGDLRAGFAAILRIPPLRRATATTMVSCAGEGMLVVCAPMLGISLAGEAGYGALLLAVLAAAALTANAVLARWAPVSGRGLGSPDAVLLLSTLVLAAAMALAAFAGSFAIAVVAAVIAGLGEGPQLTALFAVRHRESPPRLRSQIFTTGASLKITSFAFGSAVAGPLAVYSLSVALLVGAACQLLAAMAFWLSAPRRRAAVQNAS